MTSELQRRQLEIEQVELTPEEVEKALWEGKVKKWNHERNAEYWESLEGKRPKQAGKGVEK